MALLSEEEMLRVRDAVGRAEKETSGELVIAVTRRASDYAAFRALGALPLTIVLAAELQARFAPEHAWLGYLLQVPLAFAFYALLGLPAVLRRVVPRRVLLRAVEECAQRAFFELGMRQTRERSGVLLLVAEAEHRVRVLADGGILERVEPTAWQAIVDELVRGLRAGRAAEGLVLATERLGELLARHCPACPDDVDELPNDVRVL